MTDVDAGRNRELKNCMGWNRIIQDIVLRGMI